MESDSAKTENLGGGTIRYIRRNGEYFIQFPHMLAESPDPYGPLRWNMDRFVQEGQWTSTTSLKWLMEAMLANHGGAGKLEDILYALPAGLPPIDDDQILKDIEPPFQPRAGRHTIIFRLMNINNCHWVVLVHFHTIGSIVVFNPVTAAKGSASPGSDEYSERAILSHARFVQGSEAVPTKPTRLQLSIHSKACLADGWSCGLWGTGVLRTLLRLLSERRALDGEAVDYTRLRDALINAIEHDEVKPVTVGEAHRLLRRAWVSQQMPDVRLF